jgi:hypothetical protein
MNYSNHAKTFVTFDMQTQKAIISGEITEHDEVILQLLTPKSKMYKAALKRWAAKDKLESDRWWQRALSKAKQVVYDTHEDQPEIIRDRSLRELLEHQYAEKLMIQHLRIPPTYTSHQDCDSCGIVPSLPGDSSKVRRCSWCEVLSPQGATQSL